jgi:hypothetical protein
VVVEVEVIVLLVVVVAEDLENLQEQRQVVILRLL